MFAAFSAASALVLGASSESLAASRITKGPWVQRVTKDSAVVRVEVDPPSAVTLEWGPPGEDGGAIVKRSSEPASLHAIALHDLQPASRYGLTVRVDDTTAMGELVTAPPDDDDRPVRFLAYGDNRTDPAAHAAVVRAMARAPSDFLVHTGDFVEDGSNRVQWQAFFDTEAPLLRGRCLFSAVGNHELTDGSGVQYVRFFGPTDVGPAEKIRTEHLNGTTRWGRVRFFFVNAMVGAGRPTLDRAWLEQTLTAADAEANLDWRVVVLHHGPWSSGPHGDNPRLHDANVVSLLAAHKVDLVLSGHDHIYERGFGSGLGYIVTGGGGAPVYKVTKPGPHAQRIEPVRHFVDVSVTRSAIEIAATRIDGSFIEKCALKKGAGWDCGDAVDGGTPAPVITPGSGPTSAPSRCSCEIPRRGMSNGGSVSAIALLGLASWLRRRSRGLGKCGTAVDTGADGALCRDSRGARSRLVGPCLADARRLRDVS